MFMFILAISMITLFSSLVAGWNLIALLSALTVLMILIGKGLQQSMILVPENRVAVIYNGEKQVFSRLLPTGKHWISPFNEYAKASISTSAQVLSDQVQAFAQGGIPLQVKWAVTFKIDPFSLDANMQAALGKKLAEKGHLIAKSQIGHSIQHIMANYSLDDLFATGGRGRFEREVRQESANQLSQFGIKVQSVFVQEIGMPAHVQATLEAAHERAVQTESEVKALERLQKIVSQFSESDMQRLAELERMRVLGQNGVSMVMPMSYPMPTGSMDTQKMTTPMNLLGSHPLPSHMNVN